MAFYIGSHKICSVIVAGAEVHNQDKTIVSNGIYTADSGYTGLGTVTVNVAVNNQNKTLTQNGTYTADSGYTGLGTVTVNVSSSTVNNQDKTITENGTYTADNGYTGLGTVIVDVAGGTPIQEISLPVGQPLKTEEPFANETKGYVEQGDYVFSTEGDEVTEANVIQTGGTMGNDYVYTGAQSAYLTLPEAAPIQTADTWEFRTKYTFKAGQEACRILDTSADYENFSTPILSQWHNNNLYVWLSSRTGDPPDIVNAGNTGLSLVDNTTYYIKFGFTGTQYYVDYNTIGWDDTFTRQWTYTTTTKACCNAPMTLMGAPSESDVSSLGDMDLKETSITINNNLWWTGTRTVSSNYTYPDFVNTMKTYYVNGTSIEVFDGVNGTQNGGTLTKNGVFTGAQNAYIDPSVDIAFQDADSWEFRTKYTHKSSGGGSAGQCLVGRKSNSNLYHWLIYIKSDKLKIYFSSTNSGWDIQNSDSSSVYQYEFQDNVTYWLKVGFSGTEYYAYISTNGTDYTQILSVSSTSKVYNQGGMYLMKDNQESSSYAVGSMYLGETSVLINGVEYWRAANVINAKENANGLILYDLEDYTLSKYYGVDSVNNRVKLPVIDSTENIYYMVSPNYRNEAGGSPQPVPPATSDYSDLTNKPQINNVTLSGNKTSSDLGLASSSDIPDVSNFITKDVNNLTYYTTTSDLNTALGAKQNITDNSLTTTNKTITSAINEVDSIAKGANQALSYGNYSTMITAFNALDDDVYKVGQNVMIVTLNVPDLWISGIESSSSAYTYTTDEAFTTELNTNGYVQVGYYKLSALETQKVNLTNYVTFDDYATTTTTGVVKTSAQYGVSTSSYTKNLTGAIRTYEQYQSGNDVTIICKGTLENVITGKNLESANNKTTTISSSSTDNEYPSAKAVYDYIQSILNNGSN